MKTQGKIQIIFIYFSFIICSSFSIINFDFRNLVTEQKKEESKIIYNEHFLSDSQMLFPFTNSPNVDCWDELINSEGHYGFPLIMKEGPDRTLWVLFPKELIHIVEKGKFISYKLSDFLPSLKYIPLDKVSMEINKSNDIYIGLETGLWVLKNGSESKFYSTKDIFPDPVGKFEVYSLLIDKSGKVWVGQANSLCYSTGEDWNCHQIDGLKIFYDDGKDFYYDRVISGVAGKDEQIWFGTYDGKLVNYDGKNFNIIDSYDFTHSDVSYISSLSYDAKRDSIWAINSDPSSCSSDEENRTRYAVFQINNDGKWSLYKKDFFILKGADKGGNCGFSPTVITSASDGHVWLGLRWQIGLAYFDESGWNSINGNKLPISENLSEIKNSLTCELPFDDWTTDIIETTDGRLLVSNRSGVFILNRKMNIDE